MKIRQSFICPPVWTRLKYAYPSHPADFRVITMNARRVATVAITISIALFHQRSAWASDQPIDFNRDIRPILTNNCFTCHGPDENERKGDLRLDTRQGALADLGGRRAIVPGDPSKSELIKRITATNFKRMPPRKSGKQLEPKQVELLTRWIQQGAPLCRALGLCRASSSQAATGQEYRLAAKSDRLFRTGSAGKRGTVAGSRSRPLHPHSQAIARPDRLAADNRRSGPVRERPTAGSIPTTGRSTSCITSLWRALGTSLA
ncbi:MAG: hypothetical protein KatS3mg105_3331 [Gemmatales bacterium]|nr:MAG: hypothetical protein KatS3mg105_3331 [Gemmatales bacterium]